MPASREPIPLNEVAVLDANAEALGVPTRELMAEAGRQVAQVVEDRAPDGTVVVLVGSGNNGGDGLVAARHLSQDRSVTVLLAKGQPTAPLAQEAFDALPDTVTVHASQDLDDDELHELVDPAACILDALLGAGATGKPRGEVGRLLQAQAGAEAVRIAVDLPTGVGTGLAFAPDVTVALHAPKTVEGELGEQIVVDIGIPERATTHTGPGEFTLYPLPSVTQHKGQGGFVLIIGGGPYAGAPALAATAAMRTGADLSFVLTPENVWPAVASFSPNLVAHPLEGANLDFENPKNRVDLNKWLGMVDAMVIGPGLGKMDPVKPSVPIAVERALDLGIPFVADADALWALADQELDLEHHAVLTPHAKEFEMLTGKSVPTSTDVEGRVKVAREAAASLNATVLLKGPTDVVAEAQRAKRNATGSPAMSHGGTGDVLTGIVAGLLGKGLDPFDAARLGAFISGKAGEAAERDKSHGLLATDVVEAIPQVLKTYL